MSSGEEESNSIHLPVLLDEVASLGSPTVGQKWIDGTAGGGGHSRMIADAVGESGTVLCLDRDPIAICRLEECLPSNCICRTASYEAAPRILEELEWAGVDGILLDLGLSSDQLADSERGFSFQTDGELDMRFDPTEGQPVWQWLQHADEKSIADTIYRYGEERFSRRIARRIVEFRRKERLRTAAQLRSLVQHAVPRPTSRGKHRVHRGPRRNLDPATRTFQALRIFVNDELGILERSLKTIVPCLLPAAKLMIISFHSLEDRLVKHALRDDPRLEVVTKKPIQSDEAEVARNPRARSAKLRVATRVP